MEPVIAELTELLKTVDLRLIWSLGGWSVCTEESVHVISNFPVEDMAKSARRAEIMALAAGVEAAVKCPGTTKDSDFKQGAATLLPRIERRRFILAYEGVLAGRDAPESEHLFWRDLGEDMVEAYVHDEGWRFTYVTKGQVERWNVSEGTIQAGARSNLYAKLELTQDRMELCSNDGYDASRLLVVGDTHHHLAGEDGIAVAIPSRDHLLIGEAATEAACIEIFDTAAYPLSPICLWVKNGIVTART
jgi:hypothetical protein